MRNSQILRLFFNELRDPNERPERTFRTHRYACELMYGDLALLKGSSPAAIELLKGHGDVELWLWKDIEDARMGMWRNIEHARTALPENREKPTMSPVVKLKHICHMQSGLKVIIGQEGKSMLAVTDDLAVLVVSLIQRARELYQQNRKTNEC
jgi:hypothetical protein